MQQPHMSDLWWVYLVECKSGAIYTGITRDVAARYKQHAAGKGAKYTRMNPPVRLLGSWQFENRRAAAQAEVALKRLPASRKRDWEMALSIVSEPRAVPDAGAASRT
jgi:putative endonuclease